jgi:phosphatidylglycerol---prolipoprotein diacylglyceryl transferase
MVLDSIASVGWPVLDRFRIGDSIAISPHGLGIAIGFLMGSWLLMRFSVQRGIPERLANSIVFWSVIGSLVGARVAYVIAHVSDFASPLDWFKIWQGGISLLGGIAGATIANAVSIKRQEYRFRFFQAADTIAPCLALGIAVGRIGDLIIGDHLGKPTSWLLAWTYEGGTLAPPFSCSGDSCTAALHGGLTETIDRTGATLSDAAGKVLEHGIGVHQTALYDMLLAAVLFGFLWWFIRSPRREGVVTLTFALSYGCIRLLEDSLRIDKRFGPFTGSQWTALIAAIVASGLLIFWAVSPRPGPTTPGRGAPIPDDAEAPVMS